MAAEVPEDLVVREMLVLITSLGSGTEQLSEPIAMDPSVWHRWLELVEAHGLAPGLSRLMRFPRWCGMPPAWRNRCHELYLAQTARSLAAFRQFEQIRSVLNAAEIPVIPLKGIAFAGALYADPGRRQFGDVDLLVPEWAGLRAVALLEGEGYRPTPAFTSAEEEYLHERQAHFCPLARPGALPVELHTQVLKDRGYSALAREDAWSGASSDRDGVLQLDRVHATLLAATHYSTHLRLGVGHLKWMVDLLLLLRDINSQEATDALQQAAERWGITETAAPLLNAATELNKNRATLFPRVAAVTAQQLVYSPLDARDRGIASARRRIESLSQLPGMRARARYLIGLLFPSPAHLRYRYGIPEDRAVTAHRVSHPFRLARRLVAGNRRRSPAHAPAPSPKPRPDDAG